MFNYKGFYIWFNDLRGAWLVQRGYCVLGEYKSEGGAKSSVTQKWAK